MEKEELERLISRQMEGSCTTEEQAMLHAFLDREENKDLVVDVFAALMDSHPKNERYGIARFSPLLQNVLDADRQPGVRRLVPSFMKYVAAAVVLIALMGSLYLYRQQQKHKGTVARTNKQPAQPVIIPGRNGAVLTLHDGARLELDSMQNGAIATQGNAQLVMKNGTLSYRINADMSTTVMYNTMTTPRGRQFQLVLPDGTKVWLNAASTLRYPTTFIGKERTVEVNGEAYFEVVKNSAMPFRVTIDAHNQVEVLGTKFNVNAYDDEDMLHTTLLEGSVRVVNRKPVVLQPGQEARVNKQGSVTEVQQPADATQAIAWKDGVFVFNDADLPTVMRQLARWYDVEVEYAGPIPKGKFNGEIGKGLTLQQVLEGLTHTKVKYRIEKNNRIIILP